jgi:hypothetical protein
MLLNLSNHPYSQWSEKQKETAAALFGDVIDLPFPFVDPEMTTAEVKKLADDYYRQVISLLEKHKNDSKQNAVHIQGEFIFVFHLVTLLKNDSVKCVASTSKRDIQQVGTKKIINFNFIQFREY